jgi:hypothetical protein
MRTCASIDEVTALCYDAEKETTMIEFTEQQRQALTGETPIVETNTAYVLVRKDVYARLRGALDEDDVRSMEPLLADLDPEDWEDLSAYEGKP